MEEPDLPIPSPIEVARRVAALAGLLGLVLASAGWTLQPDAFWRAYFFAWLLTASVTLGCLLLAALGRVGADDRALRSVLRAGKRTTPLVAALAVPLALHGSEAGAWIISLFAAHSVAAAARCLLVGPALAALGLALATLASLTHDEPSVLSAASERALRSRLALWLATDAFLLLALALLGSPASGTTATVALLAIEVALVVWLALPGVRCRAVASVLALLLHVALLHRLLALALGVPGDSRWLPLALDLLLATALGGLWLALFFWRLDRDPPPPLAPFVDPSPGA